MKLFINTRAKRNTAFVVLLVWLFAVASGFANACVLEARTTHSHDSAAAHAIAVKEAPEISAIHAGIIASHGASSQASEAPCLKVCDDGSQSLLKHQSRFDPTDPGPLAIVWVIRTTAVLALSAFDQMDDWRPWMPKSPIRVRFSRLAL